MSLENFMYIDGIPVKIEDEKNILELCRKVGIELPTFCYHSDLSIYGACRMCMVENERGGLDAACSTPPRAGMKIKTNTARLRKYRRNILELVLANHCRDCTTCAFNRKCKLQELAQKFNIEGIVFPNRAVSTKGEDTSSACITRDQGKCILCGDCVRVCHEIQGVGAIDFAHRGANMVISTAFNKPLAESPCVGCGQCAAVCPTGAIVLKYETDDVWEAIEDESYLTSVQIAPAVRVAISKEFGLPEDENSIGRIVAALRRIGFDEIYDTSLGADLTVVEESNELFERLTENKPLPLMTSCCPAWIQYVEKKHPEMMPNISTCKSPMQMMAALLKEDAKKRGKKLFHVAVMPCTAKKHEAARDEFKVDGVPDVDKVITTQELISMIRESGIHFEELEPEAMYMPFGTYSGAGVIFGVTGGVTEAVLRRVAQKKSRFDLMEIALTGQRGLEGIKEFDVEIGESKLHVAVVSGLINAEIIIQRIKSGEHFDFVEVMSCPGGCINGGGQPYGDGQTKELRSKVLYHADKVRAIRSSEENPLIEIVYKENVGDRAHELLHVEYK